ncbi:hypothetical protein D9V37_16855 [Nocardioides mangrovicus]|uniref:HIT domain-containing protein n=1 Tax=Nocardioides mangrovicus TaxID=2478913 RepID=A0A3L8NYR5_9ACTN|nr:hypothetical protein [Nocardioides mangrovicus]RLV47797.1 hypothetical protein D9V37_16855 [Nocardioides mangrovicus]
MPESPEEFYARISAAAGADGRLPLPDMSDWRQFPWEVVDGTLVAKVLQPPVDAEEPREGTDPCRVCRSYGSDRTIWENDHFFVSMLGSHSLPLVLFLQTKEHLDFPELDDDLAAECGRLEVTLCRIMEALPHIGRVHVMRIGDGAEHMHDWFIARPERFAQIIGSLAVEWDEILPPVPEEIRRADAHEVARHLATHDGRALV